MTLTVKQMALDIVKREGGFVNDPADRGGPTKYGVTQSTLSAHLGRQATIDDVRNLTVDIATEIFMNRYFFAPRLDTIPTDLQPIVFDASVLYGPKRAIMFLQKLANEYGSKLWGDYVIRRLDVDGILGPKSRAVIKKVFDRIGLPYINAYVDERIAFCKQIVINNPSQKRFLRGWTNRANKFRVDVNDGLV